MGPIQTVEADAKWLTGSPVFSEVSDKTSEKFAGVWEAIRLAIPGILLVLAFLLPFLNKPYTIDDPAFLVEARQVLKDPLQPMSFEFCWGPGNQTCTKSAKESYGPVMSQALMGYVLVPAVLVNNGEWVAHAIQALLACLAVFEMVRLALRLGGDRIQAVAAGLLLVSIPPFLSMASTAMPDLLAMTLGLTGIERLLAWKDSRRWHQGLLVSVALGLAAFARPQLVLLLPLGALWLFNEFHIRKAVEQFKQQAYLWTPLLAAAGLTFVLNVVTHPRNFAPAIASSHVKNSMLAENLYVYLVFFAFPIPFAVTWLGVQWRKVPWLVIGPAAGVLAYHFVRFPSRSLWDEWLKTAMLYGLVALVHMMYHYVRTWDRIGILLSLWMLVALPAVVYQHFPIKYLLSALPAIVLVLIRVISTLPKSRALLVYGATVVACAGFSWILLRADADFADFGRRAAAELIAPRVAAGEKVWFAGEWGFFWYAQEAGARVSRPDQAGPNPGELLAVAVLEEGKATLDRFPNRELVDSRHYASSHGRTMGYGAGFYSNYFGRPLWVWDTKGTNDYQLWRVH